MVNVTPWGELPPNWTKATSSAGKAYYLNTSTGKSQFEKPSVEKPCANGWTREVSQSTGKVFYFHNATGKCTWEPPHGVTFTNDPPGSGGR